MSVDRDPFQITAAIDLDDLAEQLSGIDRDDLIAFVKELDGHVAEADFTRRIAAHFVAEVATETSGAVEADLRHPMQPIAWDGEVARFQENRIIRWMLEQGRLGRRFDLQTIEVQGFDAADKMQLMQLIGYSVSAYGELDFASASSVRKADEIVEVMIAAAREAP